VVIASPKSEDVGVVILDRLCGKHKSSTRPASKFSQAIASELR
jgi:hypothetical protein